MRFAPENSVVNGLIALITPPELNDGTENALSPLIDDAVLVVCNSFEARFAPCLTVCAAEPTPAAEL